MLYPPQRPRAARLPFAAAACARGRGALRAVHASGWAALASLLAGCATVDATPDYAAVAVEIRAATGANAVYQPGTEEISTARVEALLGAPLSLEGAVEVALLNNPGLKAAFRRVGVARADLEQAGMWTNPSLMLALRFPSAGGSTDIEGNLLGNLLDLWLRAPRIDGADAALRQQMSEVALRGAALAGAVRTAYAEAVATERIVAIAAENRATAMQLLALTEERFAAQAALATDVQLARLDVAATEVSVQDAQFAALAARQVLANHLGLEALRADQRFSTDLLPSGSPLLPAARLHELAGAARFDLEAASHALRAAEAELQVQRGRVSRVLRGGVAGEKEGVWAVGPAVQVEIPVFDQNQAQIARAAAIVTERTEILAGLRLAAGRDVEIARARVEAMRETARLYADDVLVTAQQALELARASYRVGKSTLVPVLEAQRTLLSARRELVVRQREVAKALSDLEVATGLPREQLFESDPKRPS
ncbi:MAG: TolC family protein [Planctomycetota bacterium]